MAGPRRYWLLTPGKKLRIPLDHSERAETRSVETVIEVRDGDETILAPSGGVFEPDEKNIFVDLRFPGDGLQEGSPATDAE
jgi:hypothetical protein